MKRTSGYLENIAFDPKLLVSFLPGKYLANFRYTVLVIIVILLAGIYGWNNLPKRLNPAIKIPIVTVSSRLPGASPQDVERTVTEPLENAIKNVEKITRYRSVSSEGSANITIEFDASISPDKAQQDVANAINTISDLPTDATTPTVKALDFEDQPVWTFTVYSKSDDALSRNRLVLRLKDALENAQATDRVVVTGYGDESVFIEISSQNILTLGLTPQVVSDSVKTALSTIPAGIVYTESLKYPVAIDPRVVDIDSLRKVPVPLPGGQNKELGSIASIQIANERLFPDLYANNKTQPVGATTIAVYKTGNTNIEDSVAEFTKTVDDVMKSVPQNQYAIQTVADNAEEVTTQFEELIGEFTTTIILVFLCLLIFLGLRQALIASVTFPLTFLTSFFVMNALGLSIDFISLFAFLIALGLLIDDTIVTIAAVTRYNATKRFTPLQTGLLVWRDFIVPLWSTTFTTLWAFLPLLIATGIIGEFIKPIPIVIAIAMLSSTTIAVLVTLPLMLQTLHFDPPKRVRIALSVGIVIIAGVIMWFALPPNPLRIGALLSLLALGLFLFYRRSFFTQRIHIHPFLINGFSRGFFNLERVSARFQRLISHILASRRLTFQTLGVIVFFAVVGFLIPAFGLIQYEFFPKSDSDLFYIQYEMPVGTREEILEQEAKKIMNDIRNDEGISFVAAQFNRAAPTGGGGQAGKSGAVLVTVRLVPKDERSQKSFEIAAEMRDQFTESNYAGKITVREQSGGPPAGADVTVTIVGPELSQLDEYANKMITYLSKQSGVINIEKSINPGTSKLAVFPQEIEMPLGALSTRDLGNSLRQNLTGSTVDSITLNDVDTDIIIKTNDPGAITKPDELTSIGSSATSVLTDANIRLAANPVLIAREDGKRTISVTASVEPGISATKINNDALSYAEKNLDLSNSYRLKSGGANEENQKSVQSILSAMLISFALILITMVIEFKSFRQALLTLSVIPIAVSGVFYVFGLFGIPLSFPALIGILALFGIVVTTAIVIVEKINENREFGMDIRTAVIEASGSRLEPIFLTSLTSILGLLTITISNPLWRGLGGAIIAGLLFAGLIKLFYLPLMYTLLYPQEKKKVEKKESETYNKET